MLARELLGRRLRHSYRFLFAPGTIGPLAWLHQNRERLDRIAHGLTLACIGDGGPLTHKRSRRGDAEIDRAMETVPRDSGDPHRVLPWETATTPRPMGWNGSAPRHSPLRSKGASSSSSCSRATGA
jgi:aminopeptidase-like protein